MGDEDVDEGLKLGTNYVKHASNISILTTASYTSPVQSAFLSDLLFRHYIIWYEFFLQEAKAS
jgi:hypothetical protein